MLPGYPGHNTRAAQPGGIVPVVHSVLAVAAPREPRLMRTFSKEPRPDHNDRRRGINISGVDFWHAVEFSRNGRFLRSLFTGPSGRFPSVFPTLPGIFRPPDQALRTCGTRSGNWICHSRRVAAHASGAVCIAPRVGQGYDLTSGPGARQIRGPEPTAP